MQHKLLIFCSVITDFFVLLLIPQVNYPQSSLLILSLRGTSHYPFPSIPEPLARVPLFCLDPVTVTSAIYNHTVFVSLKFPLQVSILFSIFPVISSFFFLSTSFSSSFFQLLSSFPSVQSFFFEFLTFYPLPLLRSFHCLCLNQPRKDNVQ